MSSQIKKLSVSYLGKAPTPEMQGKVKQMIRKKAQLYGLQQLAVYNRNTALITSRKKYTNPNIFSGPSLPLNRSATNQPQKNAKKMKAQIQSTQIPLITNYKIDSKTNKQKLFPSLVRLKDLVNDKKQIMHVFREKLDNDINNVVFWYLRILELAVQYESQVFSQKIDLQRGVLIYTLEFLTQSLIQCKFDKMALVFAVFSVSLCQFYKKIQKIGKFLFMISKVLRKVFKYEQCVITLKKALEYVWYARKHLQNEQKQRQSKKQSQIGHYSIQGSHQGVQNEYSKKHHARHQPSVSNFQALKEYQDCINTQLQIYNQLSYCLLQLNKKEESKIFGEKYQIGYSQKQSNSNIVTLSRDLIDSAQKRVVSWQRVDKRRLEMMFGISLGEYLKENQQIIKNKFNQGKFLLALKVNFEFHIDNFLKKQMFFYEVPLNTGMRDKQIQQYKMSHSRKLPTLTAKFVYKPKTQAGTLTKRSISVSNNVKKAKNQNVGENKILNYRGVGLSRSKLTDLLKSYISFIKTKLGCNGLLLKLPPLLQHIGLPLSKRQGQKLIKKRNASNSSMSHSNKMAISARN